MKIIKNFTRPVTVAQLNGELSGLGVQLIDLVQNGPEGLALYFDRCDGSADCLRLTAQRGPQGQPVLNVEFLPAADNDAPQDGAEGAQPIGSETEDGTGLKACYDPHTDGYFVADQSTNCVVAAGPYALEAVVEHWPGILIESTEVDFETDAE